MTERERRLSAVYLSMLERWDTLSEARRRQLGDYRLGFPRTGRVQYLNWLWAEASIASAIGLVKLAKARSYTGRAKQRRKWRKRLARAPAAERPVSAASRRKVEHDRARKTARSRQWPRPRLPAANNKASWRRAARAWLAEPDLLNVYGFWAGREASRPRRRTVWDPSGDRRTGPLPESRGGMFEASPAGQ